MFHRYPEDTQTLYSELLALLLAREGNREWSHLAGTFTEKTVAGIDYVYFQYSDVGGKRRQFSIGRRTPATDAIIATYGKGRDDHDADLAPIERLARLLRPAGLATVPHPVARVIDALADAGVFRLGGVLVGTYAFVLIGNGMGVHWPAGAWRTQDIDVAGHLTVATPALDADVPKALDSLKMGFVPVPELDPRHASTSFKVRGKPLRVDLITPGSDAATRPIFIPRFNAAAAPIKFLSLLLEDAQPAVAVSNGATLVTIPAPARYALHKLLISQTRSAAQQTKSRKDLHQAALLLEVLGADRPEDIEAIARVFASSGKAVTSKVVRALAGAEKQWPEAKQGAVILRRALRD
jgi:hypothetical protein